MITDYASLKAELADWLMRADLEARIPSFIQLAEAQFNRVLRTREMLGWATAVASGQYIALPSDWLKAKNVQRSHDGVPLSIKSLEELDRYRVALERGEVATPTDGPVFYALVGDSLELAPKPAADAPVTLEMAYYRKVPALGASNPHNWLLRQSPDAYLYTALVHSAPFLREDARVPVWQELSRAALAEINASEANARYSGSTLTRPPAGFS